MTLAETDLYNIISPIWPPTNQDGSKRRPAPCPEDGGADERLFPETRRTGDAIIRDSVSRAPALAK